MNRRSFLQTTAAAPFFVREMLSKPPSGKLRLAAFGASNMAYVTLQQIARNPNVTGAAAIEGESTVTSAMPTPSSTVRTVLRSACSAPSITCATNNA